MVGYERMICETCGFASMAGRRTGRAAVDVQLSHGGDRIKLPIQPEYKHQEQLRCAKRDLKEDNEIFFFDFLPEDQSMARWAEQHNNMSLFDVQTFKHAKSTGGGPTPTWSTHPKPPPTHPAI